MITLFTIIIFICFLNGCAVKKVNINLYQGDGCIRKLCENSWPLDEGFEICFDKFKLEKNVSKEYYVKNLPPSELEHHINLRVYDNNLGESEEVEKCHEQLKRVRLFLSVFSGDKNLFEINDSLGDLSPIANMNDTDKNSFYLSCSISQFAHEGVVGLLHGKGKFYQNQLNGKELRIIFKLAFPEDEPVVENIEMSLRLEAFCTTTLDYSNMPKKECY